MFTTAMRSNKALLWLICTVPAIASAYHPATNESGASAVTSGCDEVRLVPTTSTMPDELSSLKNEFNKRDDFARSTRGRLFLGIEFSKLDPLDLSIETDERFLRLASAYRFGGEKSEDWIYTWIKMTRPPPFVEIGKDFAQELFDFAYEARFGLDDVSAPVAELLEKFDAAFRRDHKLSLLKPEADSELYEKLTFTNISSSRTRRRETTNRFEPVTLTRMPLFLPSSLEASYLAALSLAEQQLQKTSQGAAWTSLHRGVLPRVAWPPPEESKGYGL